VSAVLPFPGARSRRPEPHRRGPERFLVVHLPAFRLERCGYEASEVAVLVAEERGAVRLQAVSPAASELGLRVGMTATEARALVPGLAVEPLDAAGERDDRVALVQAFRALSDRVAIMGLDSIALEVGATSHLFGGDEGLLVRARELAGQLGHACCLALADDPAAALALAGWAAGDRVAPPRQGAAALAPLPTDALRPSRALAQSLLTLGIERVGQWARLDRASVVGRFGSEGLRLHRVARGELATRLCFAGEGLPVVAEVILGGPTCLLEPVFFALNGLLAQVGEQLAARDELAVRLAIHFTLEGGAPSVVRLRVGRPTRSPSTLVRLLRARLEGFRLEAPAVELAVEVEETSPDSGWQRGLVDRTEAAERLPEVLARLADALGESALFSPELCEEWCPEAAWRAGAFRPGRPRVEVPRPGRSAAPRVDPVEVQLAHERDPPRPRPTLLLPSPQRVQVREQHGRPKRICLERGWVTVGRTEGPERLQGHWWDDGRFARDYWVVEVDGSLGWVFREGERWYLHGWFD